MAGKGLFLLMALGMLIFVQAVLSADTTYRVCVGSFSDERNASRAVDAFRGAGYAMRTENTVVNGSLRWRVTTADLFSNVRDAVRQSALIASSDTAKTLGTGYPWYIECPVSPEYAICLGSFLSEGNAASFARVLSAKGIPTFSRSALVDNRSWLRVIFARTYASADAAWEAAINLRASGIVRASGGGIPWVMKNNMPLDAALRLPSADNIPSVPSAMNPATNLVPQALPVLTSPGTNASAAVAPVLAVPVADTNPTVTFVTNSVSVVTNAASGETPADLLTNMPVEVVIPLTNAPVTNAASTNTREDGPGSAR